MDLVLIGLPGSGKSAVGRRLAARYGARFIDLDDDVEDLTGRRIPEIFATDGEAAFRSLERAAVEALGPPDPAPELRRVISPGGGAVVDPRNRWSLYRGRLPVWLHVGTEVLAQRLRRSRTVRPLLQGPDPQGRIRALALDRERFYGAAIHVNAMLPLPAVLNQVEELVGHGVPGGTMLLRAQTSIGRISLGDGIAAKAVDAALRALDARRAIIVSEPVAWEAIGDRIGAGLETSGWQVDTLMLPEGEAAKSLGVVGDAARKLALHRAERGDPLIAIGGGALGDTAGFLAATYQRGVPWIQVPTTLVAQVDSSIGGKTGVDLPTGKNLVGAFHQPSSIVLDVDALRTLPARHRRAALGEIVKMAALGDESLLATLEADGPIVGRGDTQAFERGVMAEIVERPAWAKVRVVLADEHEQGDSGGRITLNLGHTVAHALEVADGYQTLLHGEAVGYGLRAAVRIGRAMELTSALRAHRIERLLDRLELGCAPLGYPLDTVLSAAATDKKHAGGRLRWVLPTDDGVVVRNDVPDALVAQVVGAVLAGSGGPAMAPAPSGDGR